MDFVDFKLFQISSIVASVYSRACLICSSSAWTHNLSNSCQDNTDAQSGGHHHVHIFLQKSQWSPRNQMPERERSNFLPSETTHGRHVPIQYSSQCNHATWGVQTCTTHDTTCRFHLQVFQKVWHALIPLLYGVQFGSNKIRFSTVAWATIRVHPIRLQSHEHS